MHRIVSVISIVSLLVAADCIAQAQNPDDEVLAENARVKLTRGDYKVELARVPPEMRGEFAASRQRLTTLLNQILVDKTLASEARESGVDRDPEVMRRLAFEIDRFYAQAEVGKIEQDAAAKFDALASDYLPKAREIYVIDKDKFRVPEEISASHILFETAKRGDAAALALANETRAKLVAGADFGALARQISNDPTAGTNGGSLGWFTAKKMDPSFAKAAFGLKNTGDISEPVLTQFGYHLIRLDGRHPGRQKSFEEVSDQIMAQLKNRYVNETREAHIAAIRTDPATKVNQAAIDALVVKLPESPILHRPRPPVVE